MQMQTDIDANTDTPCRHNWNAYTLGFSEANDITLVAWGMVALGVIRNA
jgi:hypothetical protein